MTFSFYYGADLGPVGNFQTVTITATSASAYGEKNAPISDSAQFQTYFYNPCLDPAYVYIIAPQLADLEYVLGSGIETYDPHPDFFIATQPTVHSLCGGLTYKGLYENEEVDGNPMSYNPATKVFAAESTD